MLYRITEIEVDDKDGIEYSRISDKYEEPFENAEYTLRCHIVSINDVTIQELQNAIERDLEGKNYHSQIHFVERMIKHVTYVVGEENAKTILWNMIDSHGMSIGLRG